MPNRDGTGPFGDGRPGRGLGPCGRFDNVPRFGFGYRRGFRGRCGFGFRGRGYFPSYGVESLPAVYSYTKEDLMSQKSELESQLKWIEEQLTKKKD